ncbi:MAG: type VI secretion system-associated protein TagF [Pseudomonadota bacterium]
MEIGIFGKLPDQRDYVQHGMDAALMSKVDRWLQECLQTSKEQLDKEWLGVYLSAPIWRFWLGPDIIGKSALGALMPSVDGVGRYFPLMLAAVDEHPLDVPEFEPQEAWFQSAEAILLNALAEEGTYRGLLDDISTMPYPLRGLGGAPPSPDSRIALANLRLARQHEFYSSLSFWWSPPVGDTGAPAQAFMWKGMPPPHEYAMLLSAPYTQQQSQVSGGV